MGHAQKWRRARVATATAGIGLLALGTALVAPTAAQAAPAPAPADPTLIFEETFENEVDLLVTSLSSYTGDQGASYDADTFWQSVAACNGFILRDGSDWSGDGSGCGNSSGARDRLMELADVLGGGVTGNHVVAAYTEASGAADQTLLAQSIDSGIQLTEGRFYVGSIDIAEVNCFAPTDSTIRFGAQLPSGEVLFGEEPAVACLTGESTTVNGNEIKHGTFFSPGFLSTETGAGEYVVRNMATNGAGNDFAYDNLRFYDATPTLHKSFAQDEVEVGQPVTLELTVVNTSELSEKTGWAFTDNFPTGMTIADEPNASTTCAAATLTAEAGAATFDVAAGSIAAGVDSCTISVDVELAAGGDFTNNITGATGLDGEPSATVRALVPSMSLTKTVEPAELTADNLEAVYTFTVLNDGDVDLHDVVVADPGPIGGAGTMSPIDCGGITELAVGDSLVCTATYTGTLDDLDGASLENVASATAVSPAGTPVSAEGNAALPTVTPNPELTLVKSADTEEATEVGQVITYSFAVTNTGNVEIADVTIAEGEFSGAGELGEVACPDAAALLAPGATVTCEAEYTVIAADLTGEAITNTATAAGVGPEGAVTSEEASAEVATVAPVVPAKPAPALPVTGSDAEAMFAWLLGAFVLVGVGATALIVARRKQLNEI